MKLVIGLVGEKGSGKQTFVNYFRQIASDLAIRQVRFSDILAQTLLAWDIPGTRENYQKLGIMMKNTFGQEALAHAAEFNIENETADIIILDGARRESEIEIVRKQTPNLLVYITADQNLRYERLKNRSEKEGETGLSHEQFMKEEMIETETKIPEFGAKADVKIENNGSLEELKNKVQELFVELRRKGSF